MVDKLIYIKKFQELYKAKNGREISDTEALAHFERLISLVSAIYRPVSLSVFENGQCPLCPDEIKFEDFKDLKSKHEYLISGLCVKCQSQIFK